MSKFPHKRNDRDGYTYRFFGWCASVCRIAHRHCVLRAMKVEYFSRPYHITMGWRCEMVVLGAVICCNFINCTHTKCLRLHSIRSHFLLPYDLLDYYYHLNCYSYFVRGRQIEGNFSGRLIRLVRQCERKIKINVQFVSSAAVLHHIDKRCGCGDLFYSQTKLTHKQTDRRINSLLRVQNRIIQSSRVRCAYIVYADSMLITKSDSILHFILLTIPSDWSARWMPMDECYWCCCSSGSFAMWWNGVQRGGIRYDDESTESEIEREEKLRRISSRL